MLRGMGPLEIGLILVIVLVVFGVGKLPQVGSALGKSIHEFRKASKGELDNDKATDSKLETETAEKPAKG